MSGGIADELQIFGLLRRHAELLLEVLSRNPLVIGFGDHKWLRICLRIVNRDRHFQGVVIETLVAFLHPQIDAMRVADVIQPAPLVTPVRLHDECVIPFPMSYRISVPPWIRCVGGVPSYILGKLSTVRPDLAPHSVELKQLQHPSWHLSERNPSGHEKHIAREPERVTPLD